MLKRFSIIVLSLSFIIAGPMDPAKKNSGYNTMPGKGKKEKPFNKKGKKVSNTWTSRLVPHDSTNHAWRDLTSQCGMGWGALLLRWSLT